MKKKVIIALCFSALLLMPSAGLISHAQQTEVGEIGRDSNCAWVQVGHATDWSYIRVSCMYMGHGNCNCGDSEDWTL